jgi:hypothetical protein
LPFSHVSTYANFSKFSSILLAIFNKILLRSVADVFFHDLKASHADFTARSTSLWLHFETVQSFSPVAGFIFSNFSPSIAST